MKIKDLKELLVLPEGVSKEDFDNLEVLVSNSENDMINPTITEDSGYVVFGGKCDENGEPLELEEGEKDELPVFLITV